MSKKTISSKAKTAQTRSRKKAKGSLIATAKHLAKVKKQNEVKRKDEVKKKKSKHS